MPPRSATNAPPKKTLRSNPETLLQARIIATLGALPYVRVHRNNVGVAVYDGGARVEYGVGGKGAPDLLVEVRHRDLWVATWLEIKTPDGTVDPDQRKWHTAARHGVTLPSGHVVGGGRNVAVVRSEADAVAVVDEVAAFGSVGLGTDAWEVSRG